ncbi:glycosyltransferase family 4 protein [Microvirga calopogonii]|uniref:glycosyltransferase family 4 protein n=1 Tax=Microvirga calopogonii TaxID=2078013 RepID=UPI0013B44EF6|nr:glycosyltransferase family 4 protein [Microvirga calopogonii]
MRCIVLCPGGTRLAEQARHQGLAVIDCGEPPVSRHHPAVDALRFANRWKLIKGIPADSIFHFNDLSAVQSWGPVARLSGRHIVYHHRSLNHMTLPKRMLVNLADQIICISEACESNVEFISPDKRTFVLNPIMVSADERIRMEGRRFARELGCPEKAFLIGFVGNFWNWKRPRFFLDVCARIARERRDCHFVTFGRKGDEAEDDLRTFARDLGIAHRVTFAGFHMPGERNIAALDLLLATSMREPFGRTLVEAIITGTPYLATDSAGYRETWNRWRGGGLVPLDATADDYALHVLKVMQNPNELVLHGQDRRRVIDDVSASTHAQKVVEIYNRIKSPPVRLGRKH